MRTALRGTPGHTFGVCTWLSAVSAASEDASALEWLAAGIVSSFTKAREQTPKYWLWKAVSAISA